MTQKAARRTTRTIAPAPSESPGKTVLIVSSVHDFRMPRRGSIQAIASAFQRAGRRTIFLSVRFSALSLARDDPRSFLRDRANCFEKKDGIECYLWRTPWHPFAAGDGIGNALTKPLHALYAALPSADMDAMFAAADVILVESGLGVVLIPRMRRKNPRTLIVYRASDALATIGAHPFLQEALVRADSAIDHYCLLAQGMAPQFAFAREKAFLVSQGLQREDYAGLGESPYEGGKRHAVCVGSMLFDRRYFDVVSAALPDVEFHVIGCGVPLQGRENLHVYEEMPFTDTLPYIAHADIGIAPYRDAPSASYLAESSLKLTQYAFLRRPAVCPHFAVGTGRHRFGYAPGDVAEMIAATRSALADVYEADDAPPLSWDDIAPRLINPRAFPDTVIAPECFGA